MNTSAEVIRILQQATGQAQQANKVLDDLIVPHEYQDVAKLLIEASQALLESASSLMRVDDETALESLETAEDLLDKVYAIIDGEIDED
ncbi:MAG: hypothetical protein ACOYLB_12780 [Phototrophicaceae bacterium]